MAKPPQTPWVEMELDYIVGGDDVTIESLCEKYEVGSPRHSYDRSRKHNWKKKREQFRLRAQARALRKAETALSKKWGDEYVVLLTGIKSQVAKILNDSLDRDGKVIQPIEPVQLKDLVSTIEKALKSEKLLAGEPTGDDPQINPANMNINVLVMNALQKDRDKTGVYTFSPGDLAELNDTEQAMETPKPL